MPLFNIKDVLHVLPTPQWFIAINPYITLFTESMIPVLLIIPRTRIIGLTVALIFHFFLGFKYTGFTILVYSILCLFIPTASFDQIKLNFNRLVSKFLKLITNLTNYINWRSNRFVDYFFQFLFLLFIFFFIGFFMRGSTESYYLLSKDGLYIFVCLVLFISFIFFIVIKIKKIALDRKTSLVPNMK